MKKLVILICFLTSSAFACSEQGQEVSKVFAATNFSETAMMNILWGNENSVTTSCFQTRNSTNRATIRKTVDRTIRELFDETMLAIYDEDKTIRNLNDLITNDRGIEYKLSFTNSGAINSKVEKRLVSLMKSNVKRSAKKLLIKSVSKIQHMDLYSTIGEYDGGEAFLLYLNNNRDVVKVVFSKCGGC